MVVYLLTKSPSRVSRVERMAFFTDEKEDAFLQIPKFNVSHPKELSL
jgi:hypothetical protein